MGVVFARCCETENRIAAILLKEAKKKNYVGMLRKRLFMFTFKNLMGEVAQTTAFSQLLFLVYNKVSNLRCYIVTCFGLVTGYVNVRLSYDYGLVRLNSIRNTCLEF